MESEAPKKEKTPQEKALAHLREASNETVQTEQSMFASLKRLFVDLGKYIKETEKGLFSPYEKLSKTAILARTRLASTPEVYFTKDESIDNILSYICSEFNKIDWPSYMQIINQYDYNFRKLVLEKQDKKDKAKSEEEKKGKS